MTTGRRGQGETQRGHQQGVHQWSTGYHQAHAHGGRRYLRGGMGTRDSLAGNLAEFFAESPCAVQAQGTADENKNPWKSGVATRIAEVGAVKWLLF